jgi:virginiamycin B lyase
MQPPGTQLRSRWALAGALLLLALCAVPSAGAATPGQTTKFPLGPGTRALSLAAGPDGRIWFAGHDYALSADVVGSVSPNGEVREFDLPGRGFDSDGEIAAGVDDNLWFSDPYANAIGRVDGKGDITAFPLPSSAATPTALAAGPGGIWFTESTANKIGRIAYTGAITEFPLPAGARPSGIAVGPENALWVTEKDRGKIAKVTPAGIVTEFALPDPDSRPHAIVVGPDGNLWFSQEAAPRIGRITPAGEIEEFRVPAALGTYELAVGDDENIWFTTGNKIGSISTRGETGEPACVYSSCRHPVTALAAGPDDALWFATGLQEGGGGGTPELGELAAPGVVGTFLAPSLSMRIGPQAGRASGGLATIGFNCSGGAAGDACSGFLRLVAIQGSRRLTLSNQRYKMQPLSGRRLPLRLGRRGTRMLERRGKLVVRVTATLSEGVAANRRFVLRGRR